MNADTPVLENFYYYLSTETTVFLSLSILAIIFRNLINESNTIKQSNPKQLLMVQKGNNEVLLKITDITCASSSGNYVEIFTLTDSFIVRSTLKDLAKTLAEHDFIQTHRSHLINKSAIKGCRKRKNNNAIISQCGRELPLSKTYKTKIEHLMDSLITNK